MKKYQIYTTQEAYAKGHSHGTLTEQMIFDGVRNGSIPIDATAVEDCFMGGVLCKVGDLHGCPFPGVKKNERANGFIVRQKGETLGPYAKEQITEMWKSGKITMDATIASVGSNEFVLVEDFLLVEKTNSEETQRRILPAFLLCLFFGVFGIHRFYVGKIGTGFIQIITIGGLGLWALIDLIFITMGDFKDEHGKPITKWT